MKVVLDTEIKRLKDEEGITTFSTQERNAFMHKWKAENYEQLVFELGARADNYEFLNGIMFVMSASKITVPQLQNVIQVDAAHMNFGKYTLYSVYGNTANANMPPVTFAIIFGNEDRAGWTKFSQFAVETHPSLNSSQMTLITN